MSCVRVLVEGERCQIVCCEHAKGKTTQPPDRPPWSVCSPIFGAHSFTLSLLLANAGVHSPKALENLRGRTDIEFVVNVCIECLFSEPQDDAPCKR